VRRSVDHVLSDINEPDVVIGGVVTQDLCLIYDDLIVEGVAETFAQRLGLDLRQVPLSSHWKIDGAWLLELTLCGRLQPSF